MAESVILINGLPGSGKSTLAGALARATGLPLISKDALKEAIAGAAPDVPAPALGRAAAELMWTLAAGIRGGVILESWWFRPRDRGFAEEGLRRAGAGTVIEVWCDVPGETARDRYIRRTRPDYYEDKRHLSESWPTWITEAEPLAFGPVLRVVTDGPVDIAALVSRTTRETRW
ncbi:ATP-binding protein [Actinoplanes sp. LDG1-06]|uniref:ATP-binding protein n=1 Tax=Paractinoplanes ovalisporus TaxID=2810368 RepID=A0ABS2ATR7_9ACTN|nr:AAA family ATPase [Actinoplanes ovalisporus]MBM2622611.1 ATP-binding protein [Actinoplanes ovalisporus]